MAKCVQTLLFAHRPVEFLTRARDRQGDVFRMRLLKGQDCIVFSRPQAIDEIFAADESVLRGGQAYKKFMSFLHPESLLHLDQSKHRQRKKVVAPTLAGNVVNGYAQLAHDIATRHISRWPTNTRFQIDTAIDKLSLDITAQLVFGDATTTQPIMQQFLKSIKPYNNLAWLVVGVVLESSNKGMFASQRRRLTHLLENEIESRRQCATKETTKGHTHILDDLIRNRPATSDYSNAALSGDTFTIMLAIYFGISGMMKRTLCSISQSPAAQQRAAQEVLQTDDRADMSTLAQLPYLDAVINESLRLTPSLPMALRHASRATSIDGHEIHQGEMVAACMTLTHRRPDIFANPNQFQPERFLEKSFSSSEFCPFGGGTRSCAARQLAPMLFKAVLAPLFRLGHFQSLNTQPIPMTLKGIFMMPAKNIETRITPHSHNARSPIDSLQLANDNT